jgi:hypothetical protein
MKYKDYKVFIVEGEAREPLIINNICKNFFKHVNFKIITLPAGQNIYMLWKKLLEDNFETDVIEVLREDSEYVANQLQDLTRTDFSEIYLFFDYDGHQNNLSENLSEDVLAQMLKSFDNETENGKLYISYPMVEALRDFVPDICGNKDECYCDIFEIGNYKKMSSEKAVYTDFRNYTFDIWKYIIDVFVMRISCLLNLEKVITFEEYRNFVNPEVVYANEKREIENNKVFVLSGFPEFLLDYFQISFWRTCVKHTRYCKCVPTNEPK